MRCRYVVVAVLVACGGKVAVESGLPGGQSGDDGPPSTGDIPDSEPDATCGNGIVEVNEECDEAGDDTATCDADCTLAECGDGYINALAGECCEDSAEPLVSCTDYQWANCPCGCCSEPGDPPDEPPCDPRTVYTFAGVVSNDGDPSTPGDGLTGSWSFSGSLGIAAGDEMCVMIGADHVCRYHEILLAQSKDEFGGSSPIADGTYWANRVTQSVDVDGTPSPPGPGARCGDWLAGGATVEGEWFEASNTALTFHFDPDTAIGSIQGIGGCGEQRGIVCCFPECLER